MAMLHPETDRVVICDLCGGDPACVKRCATGAIVYEETDAPRSGAPLGAAARARRAGSDDHA
jgi:Fe-S-cluster-containing dehydrogenase component